MPTFEIPERTQKLLLKLFPRAFGDVAMVPKLVEAVVDAHSWREGHRDAVSGAYHQFALTQGSLLREEYDLSTHGHADGWVLGALLVDPLELTVFNMNHGFEAGDAFLREVVTALQAMCPTSKIVRLHGDGFAVLLGPTADEPLTVAHREKALQVLAEVGAKYTPAVQFTVGLLSLTVADPPNWQVLGPLAWAECERALVIARHAPSTEILKRELRLDGRLPELR